MAKVKNATGCATQASHDEKRSLVAYSIHYEDKSVPAVNVRIENGKMLLRVPHTSSLLLRYTGFRANTTSVNGKEMKKSQRQSKQLEALHMDDVD